MVKKSLKKIKEITKVLSRKRKGSKNIEKGILKFAEISHIVLVILG
ncbi:hypothetical protein JL105_01410 [Keratinibaculum paraultunense]|nr:hypothetical protein [Keratinibaculum paraultunense]QQY80019.1 hypothetical protein JL105_01410 [Keratinibaculum paraultunense]